MTDRVANAGIDAHTLTDREQAAIRRIVKVNHAGEYAAIRIYGAQIMVADWFWPDLVARLESMRAHEMRHCALFAKGMAERQTRACRTMWLWSWGGWWLGFLTALAGRNAIWVCTAAVEATVHRHLDHQLNYLASRDPGLTAMIEDIRSEELEHLHQAEAELAAFRRNNVLLSGFIKATTDAVIWLSTWGDSARMARDLISQTSGLPARN